MENIKERAQALQIKTESLIADAQTIAERAQELIVQDDIKRSAAALTAISLIKEAGKLLEDTHQSLATFTFEPDPNDDSLLGQLAEDARALMEEAASEMGIRPEVVPMFGLDTAEIVLSAIELLVTKAKERLSEAAPPAGQQSLVFFQS